MLIPSSVCLEKDELMVAFPWLGVGTSEPPQYRMNGDNVRHAWRTSSDALLWI